MESLGGRGPREDIAGGARAQLQVEVGLGRGWMMAIQVSKSAAL